MPLVTHQTTVRRFSYRREWGGIQELVRITRVAGIKVWTTVMDTEEIPAQVHIDLATLGYTPTNWRSKFPAEAFPK